MKTSICMIASLLSAMLLTGCDTKNETNTEDATNKVSVSQPVLAKPTGLDNKIDKDSAIPAETVFHPAP